MAYMQTYRQAVATRRANARKARRTLHTRYTLIIINAVALAALLTYGMVVRGAEASTDTAVMHAIMDSDSAQPFMLQPPTVLGAK